MITQQVAADIRMLFIGPKNFFIDILSYVPKTWAVYCVESVSDYLELPRNVNIILDASIREVIDLSEKKFSDVNLIGCASTGTNHIKFSGRPTNTLKIISLRDIPEVLNKLTSAAEFSFGLLISLAKGLVPAVKSVESGVWNRSEFPGVILKDKKLGLIGLGRIGSAMANFAESFGMSAVYYDPYLTSQTTPAIKCNSIKSLVSESDFVSLHVPYDKNKQVEPILTEDIFASFKTGSFFINTSRGELIDEDGLIKALMSGRILGAALDVLHDEPNILNNSIYKFANQTGANVIFTPHIAGYSMENVRIATNAILNKILKINFEK
jgi:phosphoglycerate dehydrogenase-like enzyme